MKNLKKLVAPFLASLLAVSVNYALAADQVPAQGKNQAQQQSQNQRMGQGQGMNQGQNQTPAFADFDLNGDGKITEEEFTEARTARISQRAVEGRQMRGLADALSFAEIDSNNDGSISPEEFAAAKALHGQQMGQGQGMQQGQGQGRGMNQGQGMQQGQGQGRGMNQGQGRGMGRMDQNDMPSFADFDLNGDGKISNEEFTEVRTAIISQRAVEGRQMRGLADALSFTEIDSNNDGSISPEELAAAKALHDQQMDQDTGQGRGMGQGQGRK